MPFTFNFISFWKSIKKELEKLEKRPITEKRAEKKNISGKRIGPA